MPQVKQPGLKFLEAAVYIMGGLLVLMFLGLIGGIVWKVTHKVEPAQPTTQLLGLALPAGSEVRSLQLDGDRLAIDTGSEIIIVDWKRNAVLSRISLSGR